MFRSIRHARPGISEGTVRVLEAWGFPWPRGKKNRWEQGCVVGGGCCFVLFCLFVCLVLFGFVCLFVCLVGWLVVWFCFVCLFVCLVVWLVGWLVVVVVASGGVVGVVVFVLVVFSQSIRSNSDQTHPSFGQ